MRNKNIKFGAGTFRGNTAAEFSTEGKKINFQSVVNFILTNEYYELADLNNSVDYHILLLLHLSIP